MSLTSRVHRLITGPTPSVGSDDWPSRYIWRWICRRRVAATLGRGRRRSPAGARARPARSRRCTRDPATSSVVERSQVVSARPAARRITRSRTPGADAVHAVFASEVAGDQREDARVVEQNAGCGHRPSTAPDTQLGQHVDLGRPGTVPRRARPCSATNSAATPRSSHQQAAIARTPDTRAITKSRRELQELSCATIRIGLHASISPNVWPCRAL